MRVLAVLALLSPPALGDTIRVPSHITAVTTYPQGAQVTRQVEIIAAPSGR